MANFGVKLCHFPSIGIFGLFYALGIALLKTLKLLECHWQGCIGGVQESQFGWVVVKLGQSDYEWRCSCYVDYRLSACGGKYKCLFKYVLNPPKTVVGGRLRMVAKHGRIKGVTVVVFAIDRWKQLFNWSSFMIV